MPSNPHLVTGVWCHECYYNRFDSAYSAVDLMWIWCGGVGEERDDISSENYSSGTTC